MFYFNKSLQLRSKIRMTEPRRIKYGKRVLILDQGLLFSLFISCLNRNGPTLSNIQKGRQVTECMCSLRKNMLSFLR